MRKGAIIGLIALAFVGWVFYSLTRVEPVKVVDSRLARAGNSVSVTGRLQNTGAEPGAVQIEIRYFDTNGKSIASDTLAIGSLQPGASLTFSSPQHVLQNLGSYSIYLNHGRNAYGN
jgi:hypothetical protein